MKNHVASNAVRALDSAVTPLAGMMTIIMTTTRMRGVSG